ncbi:major facilitator superfamily domain-containing protein [Mycena sp. CBHHK59/15]|nr:major facilitator superfamily domain-containing protein [Mycena sp. CBHHK59/15]
MATTSDSRPLGDSNLAGAKRLGVVRFWTIFLALGLTLGLSPLELAFGRRPCTLLAITLFALGSALCGSARNIPWLIAGRAIQGMGGGGVVSFTNIIVSDLVPLKDRGWIGAVLNFTWAAFAAVGPVVGGALTNAGQWRWLFYLNLPVCGLAFALVYTLVDFDAPTGLFKDRVRLLDWPGMLLIIASSTSVVLALTWSGIQYTWTSSHVLVPLLVGLFGLSAFIIYEKKIAANPITPFSLFTNRTTCSGYIQTFLVHFISLTIIYYLPTYYQACKSASARQSGIDTLGLSIALGPSVAFGSWSVSKFNRYRPQFWIGWVLLTVSLALLSTIKADSAISLSIGFSVLSSIGTGVVTSITTFPILAPVPPSKAPFGLAFLLFLRLFAGVWGTSVGGAILQNQLAKRLPAEFFALFPEDSDFAYSAIPAIASIPEPTRSEIQKAFAASISVIWKVLTGLAGLGLIVSLAMEEVPMHSKVTDDVPDDDMAAVNSDEKATGMQNGEEKDMCRPGPMNLKISFQHIDRLQPFSASGFLPVHRECCVDNGVDEQDQAHSGAFRAPLGDTHSQRTRIRFEYGCMKLCHDGWNRGTGCGAKSPAARLNCAERPRNGTVSRRPRLAQKHAERSGAMNGSDTTGCARFLTYTMTFPHDLRSQLDHMWIYATHLLFWDFPISKSEHSKFNFNLRQLGKSCPLILVSMKAPTSRQYWVSAGIIAATIFLAFVYRPTSPKDSAVYYQLKPTFPGTSPVWDVGPMPNVYLNVENTVHYQLNSSEADAEWAALVPPNGGIVHVGPDRRPFMPSVFHQLRCLNILRQAYVSDAHNTLPKHAKLASQSRHCLNYLRQMIMCRANLRLEPVVDPLEFMP